MADIARIGFVADTSDLKTAKTDLNALVPAAASAEKASTSLTGKLGTLGTTMTSKLATGIAAAKTALIGFAAVMLGALAGGAILVSLSGISSRIDDISKAASKLKVNMGDLQGLAHAADLAGLSFDELALIAQRMNKNMGDAIARGKGTEGVFKLIGISAEALSKMPIDERFGAIADKMNAMNLTADQTALILNKLGDRNGSLAALFEGGSKAIEDASNMLDRFNGKLTTPQGKQVEAMNDAITNLGTAFEALGIQAVAAFAPIAEPIITAIAEAVGVLSGGVASLIANFSEIATVVALAFGPVVLAYVASLTVSILAGLVPAVIAATTAVYGLVVALAVAALANPFTALLVAAGLVLAGLYIFRDAIKNVFGIDIVAAAKTAANGIINAIAGSYGYIKAILSNVPAIFSAAFYGGASMALKAINSFVQNAIISFNNLAAAVGAAFGVTIGDAVNPANYDLSGSDTFKAIEKRATASAEVVKGAFKEANEAFTSQMNVDNFASVGDVASKTTDQIKPATAAMTDFGGALDKAGGSAKAAGEQLTALGAINKQLTELGKPFDEASSAFSKLEELQKNGIITGDQYATMLAKIKDAFIATGGTADQWGKIIAAKTNVMTDALKSFAQTSLDSVGSALADLAVDGKADFKALADGIIKDLIRMAFQLAIVRPLMSAVFPGFASGGAFDPSGKVGLFANGGAFTNKTFNKPTPFKYGGGLGVMGEAGPEAVMPLKRGPDGSLGVESHGGGGRGGNVVQFGDINMQIESSGNDDQDKRTAEIYGDMMTERIKQIANDQISAVMSYGGSGNRRGM